MLAARYQVASLGLFGSYLHGTQRPDSDLDILVSFSEVPSRIELENYLSDLLEVKVDLVLRELSRTLAALELEVPVGSDGLEVEYEIPRQ